MLEFIQNYDNTHPITKVVASRNIQQLMQSQVTILGASKSSKKVPFQDIAYITCRYVRYLSLTYFLLFKDSDEGVFIETPSSYSFPAPSPYQKESLDTEDRLCVTLLKASLEKLQQPLPSIRMKDKENEDDKDKVRDQYRPYVILEMDHPAQRYHTSVAPNRRNGLNGSLDFRWTKEKPFQL